MTSSSCIESNRLIDTTREIPLKSVKQFSSLNKQTKQTKRQTNKHIGLKTAFKRFKNVEDALKILLKVKTILKMHKI